MPYKVVDKEKDAKELNDKRRKKIIDCKKAKGSSVKK